MAELDWARLREFAEELGFWPATTNPEDIERHRRLNKALDAAPDRETLAKKFAHLHEKSKRTGEAKRTGEFEH